MTRLLLNQMNPTIGDFEGNLLKILRAIDVAFEKGCQIVMTPELALCGYPPTDFLEFQKFRKENEEALQVLLNKSADLTLIVGSFRVSSSKVYNSAYLFHDGKELGFIDKSLLPNYDVFKERRYFDFKPAHKVFEVQGEKIAITLCEDIWEGHMGLNYGFDPLDFYAKEKPSLHLNLSASPFTLDKLQTRQKIAKSASRKLGCPTLYCNQVGGADAIIFDGTSFVCDKDTIYESAQSFEEEHLIVDTDHLKPQKMIKSSQVDLLHRALILGLKDFFHKQGFKKAILGVSGGIDSAVALVLATQALGAENVLALSMPSKYSSKGSVEDAKALCQNLDTELVSVPIKALHETALKTLEPFFKGHKPDVTEENLQARLRGLLLMAFSNKFKNLLISCGNKSEMAVGYTTLYGDLAGGLAPLSDVTKTQVYELARWINQQKPIIPKAILEKAPSAELRAGQKDSDTLLDYAILDQVIERYVVEHESPEDISKALKLQMNEVLEVIQKIHHAEFKRRQAPLGLKVTEKAFSTGWDFPIVHRWKTS